MSGKKFYSAGSWTYCFQSWKLFVTPRKTSWKSKLVLFALCSSISLIANLFLLLPGYSFLLDYPMLSIITVNILWILLSVNLYFFQSVRRNTLIAAGTAMVVAGNIKIFFNLKQLADSVTCTLHSQNWAFSTSPILKQSGGFTVNGRFQNICLWCMTISSVIALQSFLGKKVLPFVGTILVLLGTYLFIRNFLSPQTIKFKNTYITRRFIKYNEQAWHQQKFGAPLSKEERNVYSLVPSFCQTPKERKCTARFFLPVLANLCIWVIFSAVDYLLYWLIFREQVCDFSQYKGTLDILSVFNK
uniref:Dendritic cell-specific transmembrane protein-like domain-containing protein n=1 Tax=Naja naja TaxID=35670 RepID=A0A8C7E3L0_NAJNA